MADQFFPVIIVCTDGSTHTLSVCRHAGWAAAQLGASVSALHAIEPNHGILENSNFAGTVKMETAVVLPDEPAAADAGLMKSRAVLAEARIYLRAAGVMPVAALSPVGTLVETLEARRSEIRLAVIGRRGENSATAPDGLGGSLEKVIRAGVCPLLICPTVFRPVKRCLIAFDQEESCRRALEFLEGNSLLRSLECLLLTADRSDPEHEAAFDIAHTALESAGIKVGKVVHPGELGEAILREISGGDIDLLVMGTFNHSCLHEFFVGSTTTLILRSSRIPVLLFR